MYGLIKSGPRWRRGKRWSGDGPPRFRPRAKLGRPPSRFTLVKAAAASRPLKSWRLPLVRGLRFRNLLFLGSAGTIANAFEFRLQFVQLRLRKLFQIYKACAGRRDGAQQFV